MRHLITVLAVAACSQTERTDDLALDIINGTASSATTRPYAAFITFTRQNGEPSKCSGTLVAPNKVLTAAHCMECTASANVQLLGGGPPIAMASVVISPNAYPQGMDCSLNGAFDSELNDKTNVASDLAVMTLVSAATVAPIDVLIEPPLGWNPAQTMPGISSATIMGRGPANDPDGSDLDTMREGHASIDALSATPRASCAPSLATSTTVPYLQLWNSGSEAAIGHGDSGGPMIATIYGSPRVVGVASWLCDTSTDYFPATFNADNAPFLATALGKPSPGGDSDGDHVLDISDNCPTKANAQQKDGDGDGVGDVCDICPTTPDPGQENCNAEAEIALGVAAKGDACDATPCARVETTWGSAPAAYVPSPVLPCAANGYGFATCHWEMTTGFTVTPVATAGSAAVPGDIGLRHCRCDGPHDTAAQRQANCRTDCTVDGPSYTSDPLWRHLSVSGVGADPLSAVTFAPNAASVDIAWDSITDLAALGTAPLPPPPWTPDADGIVAGDHLDGIVWAHVVDNNGTSTTSNSLASAYDAADQRFREVFTWHKIPQYAPAWPWTYCAQCGIEAPWVNVADPERRIVMAMNPAGAIDLSTRLAPAVVDLMIGGRVIPASEPENVLVRSANPHRAVVVDATGSLIGTLAQSPAGVVAGALRTASLRGTDSVRLFAFSAMRHETFAVRLPTGATTAHVERFTIPEGWQTLAVTGDTIGTPLATTFRSNENALYVVDRIGASTRLVRIDLIANRAVVQVPRLLSATPRAAALSVGIDGDLVLAVDIGAGTELAWISDGPTVAPQLVGRASSRLALGGDARELGKGVHFATRADDDLAPALIPAAARRDPAKGEGLAPLL